MTVLLRVCTRDIVARLRCVAGLVASLLCRACCGLAVSMWPFAIPFRMTRESNYLDAM